MPSDVTEILAAADDAGEETRRDVLNRLLPVVYDELRRMARGRLARDGRRMTLDTTGLVHEAYVKLVDVRRVPVRNREYFFAAAARAMRQVLVDAARRRGRLKRGEGVAPVPLDEERGPVDAMAEEVLVLDLTLDRLAEKHPRAAQVLECRYFGGLDVEETAAALGIAKRTVDRDTTFAKAWLRRELRDGTGTDS